MLNLHKSSSFRSQTVLIENYHFVVVFENTILDMYKSAFFTMGFLFIRFKLFGLEKKD